MIGEFEKIVEEKGVWIEPCQKRFTAFHLDMSFPFVIMTLCLSGTARALYDQREMTHHKNDLALLLPGQLLLRRSAFPRGRLPLGGERRPHGREADPAG